MTPPELPNFGKELPHRVIDNVLDGLLEIPRSMSESISSALDKGPVGTSGPHRILDSIAKGVGAAVQSLGEGFADGFDKPTEMMKR